MQELGGKTAVVTGAGSGIGRSLGIAFARQGMRVALADIDRSALAETVAIIGAEVPETVVMPHVPATSAGPKTSMHWPMPSSIGGNGSTCCATTPASSSEA
jgi:NAD(P)-dependent dehydrogenase (short-subunit alcohol dehydrogenase family)